jgi:hypothetical protein
MAGSLVEPGHSEVAEREKAIAIDAGRVRDIVGGLKKSLGARSPGGLFCGLLGYRPAEEPVSLESAGPQEREHLAAPPVVIATAGPTPTLRLIQLRLAGDHLPGDGARPAILWLLREHPLSLIVVTTEGGEGWQLVWGIPDCTGSSPLLRRITVEPGVPLGGVARLIAMLDHSRLADASADLGEAGMRRLVDEAFDADGLRRRFLKLHQRHLTLAERSMDDVIEEPQRRREAALRLLNLLLLEGLLSGGGWSPELAGKLLGGGHADSIDAPLPSQLVKRARRELLDHFPYTLRESAWDDREVAVDPELLGAIHETKSPGRRQRGSFYTPALVVRFMVRESLRCYLRRALPTDSDSSIARLLEERNPASLRDPVAALHALRRVKLCDPACGSGAFLLGALRELLLLRECLADPFPADLRTLEIVLNSLYGVELDPQAAELTWTRLKLALLARCDPSDSPPIPDLSLQVAVGDGLLGPNPEGEWPEEIEERLAFRYARTRGRWELAQPASRPVLEERMATLRAEFMAGLRGGRPAPGFDWKVELPELFASGGFDVVLMNPPYLGASRVPGDRRATMRGYLKELRPVYGFTGDLYVHFFHRGLQLLKSGGSLVAITSDSFLTNSTKEPLRRQLLRNTVQLIMPLGSGLFPATVYSAITVVQKGRTEDTPYDIRFCNRRDVGAAGQGALRFSTDDAATVSSAQYEGSVGAVFFEPTAENSRLFTELLREGTPAGVAGREYLPLGDVAPALDTGIHSGNVRHKLFYRALPTGQVLPRLLQGTQMVRYGVWWDSPDARYRYVDVEFRPDPKQMGMGRGGRPSGRREYWRFSGPPENHLVPERILLRQTADEPFAGYLCQGDEVIYTDNTVHTLLLSEEGKARGLTYRYLLALLNSASLRWIYRAIAQERGRTLPQVKTGLVNRIPIALPRSAERGELEGLVSEIQGIHSERGFPLPEAAVARMATLQSSIDQKVSALYGL